MISPSVAIPPSIDPLAASPDKLAFVSYLLTAKALSALPVCRLVWMPLTCRENIAMRVNARGRRWRRDGVSPSYNTINVNIFEVFSVFTAKLLVGFICNPRVSIFPPRHAYVFQSIGKPQTTLVLTVPHEKIGCRVLRSIVGICI